MTHKTISVEDMSPLSLLNRPATTINSAAKNSIIEQIKQINQIHHVLTTDINKMFQTVEQNLQFMTNRTISDNEDIKFRASTLRNSGGHNTNSNIKHVNLDQIDSKETPH